MQIEVKNPSGKYVRSIHINFCGYGVEEFKEELLQELPIVDKDRHLVTDPISFFKKLQGTISKENTGRLAYYVLVKGFTLQVNSCRW